MRLLGAAGCGLLSVASAIALTAGLLDGSLGLAVVALVLELGALAVIHEAVR